MSSTITALDKKRLLFCRKQLDRMNGKMVPSHAARIGRECVAEIKAKNYEKAFMLAREIEYSMDQDDRRNV